MIIALDGPAGTGKSIVAKELAMRLQCGYLNTGGFYRMAALIVLTHHIDPLSDPDQALAQIQQSHLHISCHPYQPHYELNGQDVSQELFTPRIDAMASVVAAMSQVRAHLIDLQRQVRTQVEDLIAEGRDIATTIFPDAEIKIFLTASPQARAQRRNAQNIAAGLADNYPQVLEQIQQRDHQDSTRTASPLRQDPTAILVDTTQMSQEETFNHLYTLIRTHQNRSS